MRAARLADPTHAATRNGFRPATRFATRPTHGPGVRHSAAVLLAALAALAGQSFSAAAQTTPPGASAPPAPAAASTPGPAPAWRLDPTHSFVYFEVLHFGASTLRGRFGPLNGEITLDRTARSGRVQVVVPTAAVSTGLPVLDARLREPDMLAAEAHPQAYFIGERFEFDAQGHVTSVRGEFTLRGTSQPLTLKAQRFRCYLNPLFRREVCGGDFEAELVRSQFGITHSLPFVADKLRLLVQVEAIAP